MWVDVSSNQNTAIYHSYRDFTLNIRVEVNLYPYIDRVLAKTTTHFDPGEITGMHGSHVSYIAITPTGQADIQRSRNFNYEEYTTTWVYITTEYGNGITDVTCHLKEALLALPTLLPLERQTDDVQDKFYNGDILLLRMLDQYGKTATDEVRKWNNERRQYGARQAGSIDKLAERIRRIRARKPKRRG